VFCKKVNSFNRGIEGCRTDHGNDNGICQLFSAITDFIQNSLLLVKPGKLLEALPRWSEVWRILIWGN
jgi:hypothetical protein